MPLFNYFNVVYKKRVVDNDNKYVGDSREAHIYKIKTIHFKSSGFDDYFYFKKLMIFNINNIFKIENPEFKKLYEQFHKVELQKKKDLSFEIEEETKLYLMKEETKKMRIKRAYNKEL